MGGRRREKNAGIECREILLTRVFGIFIKSISRPNKMKFSLPKKMPSVNMSVPVGFTKISQSMSGAFTSLGQSKQNVDDNVLNEQHQQQIDLVLELLQDDITLQLPRSHLGFLTVFSSTTLSPLYHKGISFCWFKMTGLNNDSMHILDHSSRPFYSPTVDDINSKIFVQCHDNFNQG